MTDTKQTADKKSKFTFSNIQGEEITFPDYMEFATWYFSISRRVMQSRYNATTFKRMNYLATNSREAKTKI